MALKTDSYSSIQPFWHIDCPVCGGDDFTELGTGGGVWCDECNTQFKVRGTSGDPGCVVDAFFDDVCNLLHRNGDKTAYRKALTEMGCYIDDPRHRSDRLSVLYCYRIMKEPKSRGTYCHDDRGWILSVRYRLRDEEIPEVAKDSSGMPWRHLSGPLVSREVALELGKEID